MFEGKLLELQELAGALGKELTKTFRQKGLKVIGFTHSKNKYEINDSSPNELIEWQCGKESLLSEHLRKIDILILNHGIYDNSNKNSSYENSIEINALSKLKFLTLFEEIAIKNDSIVKEIWINTQKPKYYQP